VVAVVVVLDVSEALAVRAVAAFAGVSGGWVLRDVDAMVGEATCAVWLEEAAVGCGLEVGMAEAWAAVQALEEVLVLEGSWVVLTSDVVLLCTRGSDAVADAMLRRTDIEPAVAEVHVATRVGLVNCRC
jgi:hypothetical protein